MIITLQNLGPVLRNWFTLLLFDVFAENILHGA